MFKTILIITIVTLLSVKIGNCAECRNEGQDCGGLAANLPSRQCCLGEQLKCIHTDVHIADGTGLCQKVCSSEGQICSGFTRDPQVCCEGFKCVIPNTGATDLPGKCHKTA